MSSSSTSPSARPSKAGALRWMGRWAGRVLLALVLLLAAAIAAGAYLLHSDRGRTFLVDLIEEQVSQPGEFELSVGRLSGSLFGRFALTEVSIADGEGPWLSLQSAEVTWSPTALWDRQVRIHEINVQGLDLARLPAGGAEDQETADGFSLPQLPVEIDIESLTLDQADIAEPVLGEAMQFNLAASARATQADGLAASLALQRTDGTGGQIDLKAAFQPAQEIIELSLDVAEPPGGLLVRLLDLPGLPALSATLSGSGPANGWRGQLSAQAQDLAQIRSTIQLSLGPPISLALAGKSTLGPAILEEDSALSDLALLGREQDFDIQVAWDQDQETLALNQVKLTTANFRTTVSGRIDTQAETVDARLDLDLNDPSPFFPLVDPLTFSNLSAQGTVNGPLASPEIALSGDLSDLKLDLFAAPGGTFQVTVRPAGPIQDGGAPLPLTARLGFRDLSMNIPEVDPLLAGDSTVTLDGALDLGPLALSAEKLQVETDQAKLTAKGAMDLDDISGDFTGTASINQIAPLLQSLALPAGGSLLAHITVQSLEFVDGLSITLDGGLSQFKSGIAEADILIGPAPQVSGKLDLDLTTERIAITEVAVTGEHVTLDGGLQAPLSFDRLTTEYAATVSDLAVLNDSLGTDIKGAAKTQGVVEGPLTDLTVTGQLDSSELSIEGQKLSNINASYALSDLTSEPRGQVELKAGSLVGATTLKSDFQLGDDRLELADILATARDSRITGALTIPFDSPILQGEVAAELAALAPWSDMLGTAVNGQATARLILKNSDGRQGGDFSGTLKNLEITDIYVQELDFHGTSSDLFAGVLSNAKITATEIELPDGSLSRVTATAQGSPEQMAISASAAGDLSGPLDLSAESAVQLDGATTTVTLSKLSGTVAGHDLTLARPARFSMVPDGMTLEGLEATYHGGKLTADFGQSPEKVTGSLEIDQMPLSLIALAAPNLDLTGTLDGSLSITGAPDNPQAAFRLETEDLGLAGRTGQGLPNAKMEVQGALSAGRLTSNTQFSGFADKSLIIKTDLPLQVNLTDYQAELPETEPIKLTVDFNGRLGPLAELVLPHSHQLSGDAVVSLKVTGTLDEPTMTGDMDVSNGLYENLDTGTLLSDVVLNGDAEGRLLTIKELSAKAGPRGRINGTGKIDADIDKDMPVALEINFGQALLINRDDIQATADGKLKIGGPVHDMLLDGTVTTTNVEIRIDDELPPEVVNMEVIEINMKREVPDEVEEEKSAGGGLLRLDLDLVMPRRVFVRGRGLDSEWSGDLKITGSADAPNVEGQLEPVRGQFSFAGRVFKLEDGTITFDGSTDLDPLLDLKLVHSRSDFEATIAITGTATDPDIELSSRPSLPDDEILAKVLFDKSTGQLTAVEALELAAAVATLTGTGPTGAGFLDKLRAGLGVDVLRVGTTEDGRAAVTVGEYLTDGVYVGIDQGAERQSTRATVEVEVTPNITVNTDVGQDNQGRVGIKWQWDY